MTLRTVTSLKTDLTTGGSAGKDIDHKLLLDFLDSLADNSGTSTQLFKYQLLWQLIGANMNVTTDQALTKIGTFTNYLIMNIRAQNASTSLTTAQGQMYSAISKGGDAMFANGATTAYTALTGATLGQSINPSAVAFGGRADTNLYLSLTIAQGGAATADFYVFGVPLS